jgi:hypothetical protein
MLQKFRRTAFFVADNVILAVKLDFFELFSPPFFDFSRFSPAIP